MQVVEYCIKTVFICPFIHFLHYCLVFVDLSPVFVVKNWPSMETFHIYYFSLNFH